MFVFKEAVQVTRKGKPGGKPVKWKAAPTDRLVSYLRGQREVLVYSRTEALYGAFVANVQRPMMEKEKLKRIVWEKLIDGDENGLI